MPSPRVLTISFDLHVPEGLRRDIRSKRLDQAVERITGVVQGIAPAVFPWADRMTVRTSWSYAWRDQTEQFQLPTIRGQHGKRAGYTRGRSSHDGERVMASRRPTAVSGHAHIYRSRDIAGGWQPLGDVRRPACGTAPCCAEPARSAFGPASDRTTRMGLVRRATATSSGGQRRSIAFEVQPAACACERLPAQVRVVGVGPPVGGMARTAVVLHSAARTDATDVTDHLCGSRRMPGR
jgi:hypothetical protein